MRILAIETSCDETSASVVQKDPEKPYVKLLSNVVTSSLKLHKKTGGIIPEIAAREQIKYILPVINQALDEAGLRHSGERSDSRIKLNRDSGQARMTVPNIDAIAVTFGPGLIGSLLVGVETARTLSYVWNKPLIPVNHLIGHIYANFIRENSKFAARDIQFPLIALVVSGGHTDLIFMKSHGNITWLGGTRDDAAGEAFDKIGRLLGMPYPGGPAIEQAAQQGNPKAFRFPRPMIDSDDFDFSFSGLKTAVLREVKKHRHSGKAASGSRLQNRSWTSQDDDLINDISASVQQAIIDVLVAKTLKAAQKHKVNSILLGGGVAANEMLRERFAFEIRNLKLEISLSVPPKNLCTDNGAMIAAAAIFNYKPVLPSKLTAEAQLYF